MGGGSQPAAPATPAPAPSVGETSREAIQAQIDALPEILRSQQEFGPQFSALQLQELQKFGPEFAQTALDLQREFGPQFADVERSLSPELAGAQDALAEFFSETDDEEFERLRGGLVEDVRAGQSIRGIGDISPLGAVDESVQVARLRKSLKDRRLNVALSTAGRVPIGGVPNVQGTTGTSQLVQNVSPQNIFGAQASINAFNQSIFGTQAGIFGTQQTAATARRGQNLDFVTDILGTDVAGLGAGKAFGIPGFG